MESAASYLSLALRLVTSHQKRSNLPTEPLYKNQPVKNPAYMYRLNNKVVFLVFMIRYANLLLAPVVYLEWYQSSLLNLGKRVGKKHIPML